MKLKTFSVILLSATWELPQTISALLFLLIHRTDFLDKKDRRRYIHHNSFYTCFSCGEFIFFRDAYMGFASFEKTEKHELGHSIQSRILGPLFLPLIAFPSTVWNLLSRMNNRVGKWMALNYYNTPWESWADKLGKVQR
ncbi:MAG: hypothetical protein K6F82_06740 [Sphaerochaetaceae bacterium]|nr:hypothetical protein [Sphaerochaetaceae bacterium]